MITLETAIALALRDPVVMDRLGEALRNDLVTSNPFYRRCVEFADEFLLEKRHLPRDGDWAVWLTTLDEGMQRDGTREALGRLLGEDTSGYDPAYFAEQALPLLKQGAAQVARARLNELAAVTPEAFQTLAAKVEAIEAGGLRGLARLDDIDTWAKPSREDDIVRTGYPTLDDLIGGWGKELWLVFADSGIGKSMLLQCFATAVALRGSRVLHVTLELGVRPQIHRYYRQIAQAARSEFSSDLDRVKGRLRHWFRLAQGEVLLQEYPAYGLTTDELARTLERVQRSFGEVDVLVLDYLDLLALPKRLQGRSEYADLGRLTHETRALCPAFDLSVLTASQAVRKPERAGRLSMRDMGDSYNKVRGVDGLLYLVQTPEEEEVHQGRLGVLKSRDTGGRGAEIALYMNRELALIRELDHPNTVELMRQLGHLPATKPPGANVGSG